MNRDEVKEGYDYWWNMSPREDGSPRRSVIRVTSAVREEKIGKDGDRLDDVVDAVFLQRDGTKESTRYPVRIRFLDPVAYAQDLENGEVVCWQKQDFKTGNYYYPEVTVNGPRDDETGMVPVIWHHERASRDGTKPAGDSYHNVPNHYLFRKEAVEVMRGATQTRAPQTRTASSSNPGRSPAAPTSGIDRKKFDLMVTVVADLAEQAGMAEDATVLRNESLPTSYSGGSRAPR